MWNYLIAWTLVSIAMAPLVGRFLAHQDRDHPREVRAVRASGMPLIPAQRTVVAPHGPSVLLPQQARSARDETRYRGH